MKHNYLSLNNQNDLIEGVVVRKLTVHKDDSGILFETLRRDWQDVYNNQDRSFVMQYMSQTPSGQVRDKDKWHFHKNQEDRFICTSGRIVTAVYDTRENSKTKGKLNLFLMGPENDDEMYILVIPKEACHGFMVISKSPGHLLNFPTQLYNPDDEIRKENKEFNWNEVGEDFNIK